MFYYGFSMSNIIQTSDLQTFMNTTLTTAIVTDVVNAINQYIENFTNRFWGGTTSVTERYDWAPIIWLRHQDIVTTAGAMTVVLGYPNKMQETLDSTSYFWNEWGRVTMYLQQPRQYNPSAVNNDLVQITYEHGVATVPEDLFAAALGIAANFYNWATNNQKDIVSASVGSYRLEFSGAVRGVGGGPDGNAPPVANSTMQQHWNTLNSYRMRRL